jgi:hypothetical protein
VKLPLYLTLSAAAHLVVAIVVDVDPPARKPEPLQTTSVEIVLAPPPPVVAPRVVEPAVQPPEPAPRPVATKRAPTTRAPSVSSSTAGTAGTAGTIVETPGTPVRPEVAPGPRSKYLDMRTGSRVDLSLPASRDDLDHAPAGTAPQRGVATSGQLESAAGGRKKSDQNVFVAKVERDGSVRLTDKANLDIELSPNPARFLSGRFDVTDYLMRKTGNDPYASRKLKFLDETRDERVAIGKQWRKEQLQQTAIIMKQNLVRAWAQSPDIPSRKRALFALWDEIVEPTTAADQADEVLAEASRAARRAVIGFIRARLPAGSEHAYSEAELAAFNARKQSAATFAPYE